MIKSSDDYTTSLNSLAICVRVPNDVALSGAIIEASLSNLDDDDLILTPEDLGEEKYSDDDYFLPMHSSLMHRQHRQNPDSKKLLASSKFHRVSNYSEEKEEDIFRHPDARCDSSSVQELVNDERVEDIPDDHPDKPTEAAFLAFRFNYLIVTIAIMLADGLQGMIFIFRIFDTLVPHTPEYSEYMIHFPSFDVLIFHLLFIFKQEPIFMCFTKGMVIRWRLCTASAL